MPDAGLRTSAVRGGIYLVSRQAIAAGLKLIGVLLITRVLGPTRYGAFVAAYNIYQYALLLGQAGVGIYLLRYHGDLPEAARRTAYTLLLGTGLLLALALEALRGPLSGWVGITGFSDVLTVMAFALPFQLLLIPATTLLERKLDYRAVATVEIGSDVAYYALAAVLVLSGEGPVALGISLLVQQALFFVLAHHLSRTWPRFGFDKGTVREIAAYAATYSFANWIWQLRMLVNPLVAAPALGARDVGLIGMTVGILEMLSVIKTVVWRLSVSVLGRLQHDAEKLRRAVTEGMEMQTLGVGAILLGFGWFGWLIIPIVFGTRWLPVMDYYPYVALAYLTVAAFNVHSAVMAVVDRNRDLGLCFIVHVALFGGTAWYAVRHFGPVGYGYGELAGIPAFLLVHLVLARAVGSPKYGVAALWWCGAAVGLFWQQLGLWAVAVPFVALLMPASLGRIAGYAAMIRRPRASPPPSAEPA